MQETLVRFLHREDPLEEGMATHSSILAWRIPIDRGAWWAFLHEVAKSQTELSNWTELNDKIATDDIKKRALGRAGDHDTGGQMST